VACLGSEETPGKSENDEMRKLWLLRWGWPSSKEVMIRPVDSLIEYLQAEQARGRSHVFLDDAARDGLRQLYIQMRKKPTPAPAATATAQALPVTQELSISGDDKSEKLQSLRKQAETWAPARSLGTLRESLVFASGSPDAQIMLIGDAAGYHEEKEAQPFVGPAGQKLTDILKAMGLRREEVYISNLVKFRPAMPRQTTNNRKPSPEEMAACLPILLAEISIVQPKLIITLGSIAAEGLLGLSSSIESMRNAWHEVIGIPTRVTYHPSYLLQTDAGNEVKRALWEDMLTAMDKLGMPISEKQKAFFLPKA